MPAKLKKTNSPLGSVIRRARLRRRWSLKFLADQLGITRQYVSKIEHGSSHLRDNGALRDQIIELLDLNQAEIEELVPRRKLVSHPPQKRTLGWWLYTGHHRLKLNQQPIALQAHTNHSTISTLERNTYKYHAGPELLGRIGRAIGKKVPRRFLRRHQNSH